MKNSGDLYRQAKEDVTGLTLWLFIYIKKKLIFSGTQYNNTNLSTILPYCLSGL